MKTQTYLTHYEKTILDNIDLEPYGASNDCYTYDKVKTCYNIFKSEYCHKNNAHIPQNKLFVEWLQGLPSALTVPFYNNEILENAQKAGFNLMTETTEDNFLEMYWSNLANAFFTLYENL